MSADWTPPHGIARPVRLIDQIVAHPMRAHVVEELATLFCADQPDVASSIIADWTDRYRRIAAVRADAY